MVEAQIVTQPVWMETPLPSYPRLDRDLEVDVAIVGGGLTGITTAYLLRQEGVRVVLLERGRIAGGDTARTTAHLTYVTDTRLNELVARFGKTTAKEVWKAGAVAIDRITNIAAQTGADCDLFRLPGYLHSPLTHSAPDPDSEELKLLQMDAALAQEFGFAARFMHSVPGVDRPGVRFENQARFHPRKYLAPLLETIPSDDSYIFEDTAFEQIEERPFAIYANGRRIRCDYLVIATHSPIVGKGGKSTFDQRQLSLYTSYVLGARAAPGELPEGLFWDTGDPYHYLRVDDDVDHQYLIYGGEDVKAGRGQDFAATFGKLARKLQTLAPSSDVRHQWHGQVVVTEDGLPFIGEHADRAFLATGFCGNGFTFGTLAAFMARDRFLDRHNPWFELFGLQRARLAATL